MGKTMMGHAVISTEGLSKRFGNRVAVDSLTVAVGAGEIVGLLGPNGAGKTTTLRMLAGIIAPSAGHAVVDGRDPASEPENVHESVGFLTESPGFYERLSAERNLAYFAAFYEGIDAKAAAARELARLGLADRARDKVGTFSKGMKQRLALARVLLHEPRILFLDEPTAGLDPEAARNLRELIVSLKKDGCTILLSTHNLSEAEELSDRIAVFRTRLVAIDTPRALRESQFERRLRVRLDGGTETCLAALRGEPYVRDAHEEEDGVLTMLLSDPDRDRPRLVARIVQAGGQVLEVREDERPLEDVYLSLVREEEA
ncbi:MAG: ABC transporter ATP-binding protein [Candidatus Bipolaricaulota bacterium]|nr:ABC transporter ATP-binding protein [Candidatus Bipolaricaulota bacterium]